jgi:putative lipoprotein
MKLCWLLQRSKMMMVFLTSCILTACVAVDHIEPISISGSVSFGQKVSLPNDAVMTVALVDLNHPGVVFEKQLYAVNPEAVFFQFILSPDEIKEDAEYGLVAVVIHKDAILYQTYGRYRVINNNRFVQQLILEKL